MLTTISESSCFEKFTKYFWGTMFTTSNCRPKAVRGVSVICPETLWKRCLLIKGPIYLGRKELLMTHPSFHSHREIQIRQNWPPTSVSNKNIIKNLGSCGGILDSKADRPLYSLKNSSQVEKNAGQIEFASTFLKKTVKS